MDYYKIDNTCNYSKDWQPYIGEYDKFEYDIKTRDGKVVTNCYPNAGTFISMTEKNEDRHVLQEDVVEIRFSEKPIMGINYDEFYL